jgi:hypothetical protein
VEKRNAEKVEVGKHLSNEELETPDVDGSGSEWE